MFPVSGPFSVHKLLKDQLLTPEGQRAYLNSNFEWNQIILKEFSKKMKHFLDKRSDKSSDKGFDSDEEVAKLTDKRLVKTKKNLQSL